MDKREACHRLADINERIYEMEDGIHNIEINLYGCKESEREWYLEKKEKLMGELERCKQGHDDFISEYGDSIYS